MKKAKFLFIALMLTLCTMANAQSVRSIAKGCEKLLDAYCIEYYNQDFRGRSYIEGSIVVNIPSDPEEMEDPFTGSLNLKGTHSYRGQFRKMHSGVKWRASVKKMGGNKYKIKFDKYYEPDWLDDGHWENGPTRIFDYQ